jgi:hypothetical protein
MLDICRLKYPNYDVNKNKIEIKRPHILLGLNGHAVSNEANTCFVSCFDFSQPLSVLFD